MEYPKTVVLESEKLKKLLKEKADLVLDGRAISDEIIALEAEMDSVDKEIQEVEKGVDTKDLQEKAQGITERFNVIMEEMEAIKKETFARMKGVIGDELPNKYEALKKKKEQLENDRNKIGLKIQKYNDKLIPLGQKLMKPHLKDEFEDFDTLRLENGEAVGTIFSHLDDFYKRFRKGQKKVVGN